MGRLVLKLYCTTKNIAKIVKLYTLKSNILLVKSEVFKTPPTIDHPLPYI
jgi:hypothetical protein